MKVRIRPGALGGCVKAPVSKSDAHRSLIFAALADGPTQILLEQSNNDIDVTVACLKAMGASIAGDNGMLSVYPGPMKDSPLLDCGESGSTFRFLLPVAAAFCQSAWFTGGGRLPERPIRELTACMTQNGARFSGEKLPFTVSGPLRPGTYTLPGDVSSQYISGLLFALPLLDGESFVRLTTPLESSGYVDMTLDTMARFHAGVHREADGFRVPGGQRYHAGEQLCVQGDWSGAAFFLAAGALGGGVAMGGLSPGALQGDRAIAELLTGFGASVTWRDGEVCVTPGKLRGIDIDVSNIPDLVPILAVLGAVAEGKTRLYNAGRLRLKESDRLSSVSVMLRALGGRVEEAADALTIYGGGGLQGGTVDSVGDHRITMAAAIAASVCEGETEILGAQAADKSYPAFFAEYVRLGGDVFGFDDR